LLIPKLSRIEIFPDKNKTDTEILYYEKDNNGKELAPVTFDQLAMGMRNIIGLIGDIIQRLSEGRVFSASENRSIFEIQINPFKHISELSGIVIIDEFDNHLHPEWQRYLVSKLSELFPKIQFIVSTHSPIPFLGAPKNSIFIKVDRNKERGVILEKLDIEVSKLTPNSILSSPIFGFENINSNEVDIDEVETADRYSNIEAEKRMKEKLQILKQSDNDFFKSLKVE
jgi:hypothetical protein